MDIYPLAWEEGEWLFQPIVILQREPSAYVEDVCLVLQGLSIYIFKAQRSHSPQYFTR